MSEVIDHGSYIFTFGKEPHIKFKRGHEALRVSVVDGVSVVIIGSREQNKYRLQWFFHFDGQWYSDYMLTNEDEIDSDIALQLKQVSETLKELKTKSS